MGDESEHRPHGAAPARRAHDRAHAPGKRTLTGALPHGATSRPATPKRGEPIQLEVTVYGHDGEILRTWLSRGVWEGPLPQHFTGARAEGRWTWSNPYAVHTKVHTNADGGGGIPVETWATGLHGSRVEIYASALHEASDGEDGGEGQHARGDDEEDSPADVLERELGIDDGWDPDGHTGPDASPSGTGPGGERARAGGQAEGSETSKGNEGTASGDKDGVELGSENGLFGGEGHEGDHGVRGAGAILGGLIAVPSALQGPVEMALLIQAGDVTGAAEALFMQGVGKSLSAAGMRVIVAREARNAAAVHIRKVAKALKASKAFRALSKAERDQVLRIAYWETQREYFRAYLAAAKREQRAAKRALSRGQVGEYSRRTKTADRGIEVATVEPVAGKLPANHGYAGGEFPAESLPPAYRSKGVRFTDRGFPDFEPHAMTLPNGKKTVRIEFKGSRDADFAAANAKCGYAKTPKHYTWHHTENEGEMMLVPQDLHDAVRHTGGVAQYKQRTGRMDYDE